MGLNLNFSGVENKFPLFEGDFDFIITEAEVKPSAKGDSQNLIIRVEIQNGEDAGKSFPQYINIQESTMWRVKAFFDAVMGEDVEDVDIEVDDLVGQAVSGTVTNDGQYNSVVSWVTTS